MSRWPLAEERLPPLPQGTAAAVFPLWCHAGTTHLHHGKVVDSPVGVQATGGSGDDGDGPAVGLSG